MTYKRITSAFQLARKKAKLDPVIQPSFGCRKYFENALDHANIDHERKMVIEGHFAGTRAKHYTDRDLDELRTLYAMAYPFIALEVEGSGETKTEPTGWGRRITELEIECRRNRLLETRLGSSRRRNLQTQRPSGKMERVGRHLTIKSQGPSSSLVSNLVDTSQVHHGNSGQ